MTLSVVRAINVSELERSAELVANKCADEHTPGWSCAFHHAIDLIAYSRGIRTTTRCLANYQPNEIERRVERLLAEKCVRRGMREHS